MIRSLFKKIDDNQCVCIICDTIVENSTEARDAHLNSVEINGTSKEKKAHKNLYERNKK